MDVSVAGFEIVTFTTASVAAIVAIWSLVWHLRLRRAVSRLKVTDGHGVLLGADGGELVVIVRAENTGPLPINVTDWGFRAKGGRLLVPAGPLPESTDVPVVLQPGEDASFFVLMDDFERALQEIGSARARPFVTIVPRRAVRAARRVRPAASIGGLPRVETPRVLERESPTLRSRFDAGTFDT